MENVSEFEFEFVGFEEDLFKVHKFPILPRIMIIGDSIWTMNPEDESDEMFKWFLNNASETLAFYHPYTDTIFIRSGAFSLRILFHELVHWLLFRLFHNSWHCQDWWDTHTLFMWHMVKIAVKVGLLTKEEIWNLMHGIPEELNGRMVDFVRKEGEKHGD